jgi:hypothetical protein
MKKSSYMTRALKHSDRRFARILGGLGYESADLVATDQQRKPQAKPTRIDDLAALRDEYQKALGKRPFHGWDAAALRAKIDEAKG